MYYISIFFCQVGDLGKKGWSTLAGSNVSSPTDGYGSGAGNGMGGSIGGNNSYQSASGNGQNGAEDKFSGWGDDNFNSTNS